MSFQLDQRLQADCIELGDLRLCRLLLMNESRFPWCVLVPRRAGIREVFELAAADQELLWRETTALAREMNTAFAAHKMNFAAFGNLVPQLHVHVIARFDHDEAWPGPAIGRFKPEPYSKEALAEVQTRLRALLPRIDGAS